MKPRILVGLSLWLLATLTSSTLSAPAAPDPDKEAAFRWLDANADGMRRVSLNIWNTPELALHEYKSSRELMAYLESNGFHVEKGVAGMPTAFIATLHRRPPRSARRWRKARRGCKSRSARSTRQVTSISNC